MLTKPTCFTRRCKHFIGVKNDGDETTERVYCEAFSNKIPDEISYGNNKHLRPLKGQGNDIVYEKES